jgi:hypothetical protein
MTTPTIQAPPSNGPVAPKTPVASPDSKRGRRPGIPAKERADIPADEFQLTQLSEKARADRRRKREPRKGQQLSVDQIVFDIFQANVESGFDHGTIANWSDLEVYDWAISATHAETAEFMIKKACTFYGRRPIWGERIEISAKETHTIPDPDTGEETPCHMNGKEHVHIPFTVVRRPKRRSTAE